ncbi:MAG: tetratricopeptide repeat protein [Methylacidiphilales bacterium]|nr:tetratricopeptide repeat protein [Candidatus Methylacidiphilales bacterium]
MHIIIKSLILLSISLVTSVGYANELKTTDTPLAAPPVAPLTLIEIFDQVNKALVSEDFQKALDLLNQGLTLQPTNAVAYKLRGDIHLKFNKTPEAIADFEKAIEIRPSYHEVAFELATIYKKQEKYQKALQLITNALIENERNIKYYALRASLYLALQSKQLAYLDYSTINQLEPSDSTYLASAQILYELGKNDKVISETSKGIALNSNNDRLIFLRGLAYKSKLNCKNATNDFNKSLQLKPNTNEYLFERAQCNNSIGKYSEALVDINTVISSQPKNIEFLLQLGIIRGNLNEFQTAREVYDQAIALDPNNSTAFFLRGIIFEKNNQHGLALKDYNKAIQLQPNYQSALFNRANLFRKTKDYESSLRDVSKLIALNSLDDSLYVTRGLIYLEANNESAAEQDFSKAIDLNKGSVGAYLERAKLYISQNKNAKAREDLKILTSIAPTSLEVKALLKTIGWY